ncbi:tyrosine-type recombinase/integrase [Roseimaritima sediminicola]|uniref:tyrosine-type recombinase/integrase n=1 Tax=Roseimaritima sediminicola TaxID=2662066 RepID=UPI00192A5F8B|nr:tyrosine-type recombinase/integrase [Roseimaritima sediminicola]
MGRPPKVWCRKQTGTFYCTIDGRRIPLGKDRAAADKKFHELMARPIDAAAQCTTLYDLCQLYLDWVEDNRAPRTYDQLRHYLRSFIGHIGKRMKAGDLKGHHVCGWYEQLRAEPTKAEIAQAQKDGAKAKGRKLSSTSQSDAAGSVMRMLSWAVERGHIDANPIATMKRPERKRRDVCYSPAEWEAIMKHATGPLVDFLQFLALTGCRPTEARKVEARNIHGDQVIFEIKNSKGQLERRVIYLVEEAKAILDRLASKQPTGPLFRNTKNRPWTKDAIVCRMKRIRTKAAKELGYDLPVMAYGARHTYATNALQNGVDSTAVAGLMGHRDTTMVARTYSHLLKNPEHLRLQAKRAIG